MAATRSPGSTYKSVPLRLATTTPWLRASADAMALYEDRCRVCVRALTQVAVGCRSAVSGRPRALPRFTGRFASDGSVLCLSRFSERVF